MGIGRHCFRRRRVTASGSRAALRTGYKACDLRPSNLRQRRRRADRSAAAPDRVIPSKPDCEKTADERERQGADDDHHHPQGRLPRQLADEQGAERSDPHLRCAEEAGRRPGDLGVDAECRGQPRRLAEAVADRAQRHRHEQGPCRQLSAERPSSKQYPGCQRDRETEEEQPGAAEPHREPHRAGVADKISGHRQQDHQSISARRLVQKIRQEVGRYRQKGKPGGAGERRGQRVAEKGWGTQQGAQGSRDSAGTE